MEITTVAVVGAGTIGRGLALDLAMREYQVILNDVAEDLLEQARAAMRSDLKSYRMLVPEYREVDDEALLGRIRFAADLAAVAGAGFVIENIIEQYDEKARLYARLSAICGKETVYGVNTSCISITKLAQHVPDPSRMIGMHFMNPVPMKKFVEMIRGERTSEQTVETATALVTRLGKDHVLVKDFPGFVANRVMMLAVNECAFIVQDAVATPADVDKVFRLAFGHGMGPLATADLIGLDTVLNSILVLFDEYKDSKYRPCPLLQKMVDAGKLGRKSGQGFFKYSR
ncbi:MAG TPA: 3-hydroxyacyl-CoA dehydrogenase NAD-binding domain-containing protein [Burkholderiales bacterium]|jgi:3-hydroxybutyryl-CoA dehydrogenase|nr:3-hydroxyacyl-CoA dehydrogenase NAD-binding domain-containing protein [Burkholderiales bacterium]